MRSTVVATLAIASLAWAAALPQVLKNRPLPLPERALAHPSAADAVRLLSPGQITIKARHPAVVDLRFRIADGLHINSHLPRERTLIPTRLAVVEGQGINVTEVDFPPGADYAPVFSPKEKLSVYSGEFVLRAHLTAEPGQHLFQAALHYQACDANSCMPPRALPVTLSVAAN